VRSLDRAFVGGLAWTAAGKWATQLFTWASVVALARILSPAELGLSGMAGLFILVPKILAEFGLGSAVVQMRDLGEEAIGQLQTVSVLICVFVFIAGALLSPFGAAFFEAPQVRWLLVANCATLILFGFQSIPLAKLRRALDYRRLAVLEAIDMVVRSSVSVAVALMGASFWSMVIGGASALLVSTVTMNVWAGTRLRIPRWQTVKEPLTFGLRVSVAGLAGALTGEADPLIVAKRLGESGLGTYRLAMDIASAPAQKINMLLMRVSGPLMASIQKDMVLMRRYFLRIAEPLSLSIFPAVTGFALVAPDAVILLLGEQWRAAVLPVQLLSLNAGIASLSTLTRQVLISLHETRFLMYLSLVKFTILPVVFIFVSPYGLAAVAIVWLCANPIDFIILTRKMASRTELPLSDYGRTVLPSIVACTVMVAGLAGLQATDWLAGLPLLARLVIQGVMGGGCYMGILFLFWRERVMAYVRFLRNVRTA